MPKDLSRTASSSFYGGAQFVSSGGSSLAATVSSGGMLAVLQGGVVSSVTLNAGGTMSTCGGMFPGTNALNGNFSVAGAGNSINKLSASSTAAISYDLREMQASSTSVMLKAATAQSTAQAANYSVVVNAHQQIGVYELSSNILLANNTAFGISLGATSLGSAALNGAGLISYGVSYDVQTTGAKGQVNLTLSAHFGALCKGDASANALSGTDHSDIFYGGGGNDSISVGNGRDVVVYDGANWGRDTITDNGGTPTLPFAGLSSADITKTLSGATMSISRAGDASQTITVQNWNDNTHSIVYGGSLSAFNTWLNAASPTSAQANAARDEVWQKTGLLASA